MRQENRIRVGTILRYPLLWSPVCSITIKAVGIQPVDQLYDKVLIVVTRMTTLPLVVSSANSLWEN